MSSEQLEKAVQVEVNKNDISWIKDELKTQSGLLWTMLFTILAALASMVFDVSSLKASAMSFLNFIKTIFLV